MSTVSDTPFWDSKLNFSSFNIGFKGETSSNNQSWQTKLNKLTTDSIINNQSEEFSFSIILDDFTKSQISSLHSRGYELHQIVQEVFNLSRADGRKYKRIRDVIAEFIASLEEEDNNDT